MSEKSAKPNIFRYRECSEFLNDLYKFRKRTEPSFSYEKWAQEMDLRSRSYLRYICRGEKPPTATILPNLLRGLNLNSEESSYFITLVNLASTTDSSVKALYTKEIFRCWTQKIQETPVTEVLEFLADPMIPQLFTYLSFEDSPTNVNQWIQDLRSTPERIQNALRCLIWQKLVEGQLLENGEIRYRTTNSFFKVPTTPANSHIRNFHLEGLEQAKEAVNKSPETRKMYSAFFALSADQFQRAQELIQNFNSQILAVFNEKTIGGKKLYRLNQQLLSVSEDVQGPVQE